MLVIQVRRRLRQEDYQFKANLDYISKTLAKTNLKGGEGEELYRTGQKYGQKGNSEIRTENLNVLRLHKDIPGTDINNVLTWKSHVLAG